MQSSALENRLERKQQNPIILAASSSYFGEQLWLLHKPELQPKAKAFLSSFRQKNAGRAE